jgi:hypothetical protein
MLIDKKLYFSNATWYAPDTQPFFKDCNAHRKMRLCWTCLNFRMTAVPIANFKLSAWTRVNIFQYVFYSLWTLYIEIKLLSNFFTNFTNIWAKYNKRNKCLACCQPSMQSVPDVLRSAGPGEQSLQSRIGSLYEKPVLKQPHCAWIMFSLSLQPWFATHPTWFEVSWQRSPMCGRWCPLSWRADSVAGAAAAYKHAN